MAYKLNLLYLSNLIGNNMPIHFIIRDQFSQWMRPNPTFWWGCRAHAKLNLVSGDETKYTVNVFIEVGTKGFCSTSECSIQPLCNCIFSVIMCGEAEPPSFQMWGGNCPPCPPFSYPFDILMEIGFIWVPLVQSDYEFYSSWLVKSLIVQDMNKPLTASKWMPEMCVCHQTPLQ